MNLYHLRVFMTVAEHEHITRASEELYLSQPAVTKIVQSLEQEVGQKLVERQGRRIALTYAGQVLKTYARRMFSLEREMEEALAALSDIETGEVTLAVNAITGIYLLPSIVARFRARYPCVKINLEILKSREIIEETVEWRLDFGLVEVDPSELPLGLDFETIAHDELILVVAPNHPWSELSSIKPEELRDGVLILREPGSGVRESIEHAFSHQGYSLSPLLTVPDSEVIKQMALKGVGATMISAMSVRRELESGDLLRLPIVDLEMRPQLSMVWREDKQFSPAAQAFRDLLRREVRLMEDMQKSVS
ncbi:MAG TPA: LysR family transcriptional regulator [Ktedonobacteraceae bacterium]|nr:LysR family transcriptional regulator [Ktedonobacteraceae bacterium]